MRTINMDVFYNAVMRILEDLETKETTHIQEAARLCATAMANDGVVHIFGSGHSVGFGAECTGRAGSLVPFHMIETSDFVTKGLYSFAEFKDPDHIFERRPNIADKLYDLYDIRPQDVFIVISNSGINGLVIDLAQTAKDKGHPVIVITSLLHTLAEPSRHPSGKKLFELGDVVIDNCGPRGDALLSTGGEEKVCSISSITGIYIAQALTIEICKALEEDHQAIPLLHSEEVKGYAKHNEKLMKHYQGRINL
jgi:uncharacterized phosphosugar-binding protein